MLIRFPLSAIGLLTISYIGRSTRKNWLLTAVMALATLTCNLAQAQKQWDTGDGNWSVPGNWFLFGTPQPWHDVEIGSHPAAANSSVTMNLDVVVNSLEVSDGMQLFTDGFQLTSTDETVVTGGQPNGANSSYLYLQNGAAGVDFQTGALTVSDRARMILLGSPIMNVNSGRMQILSDSTLRGSGIINLSGNDPQANLLNQGTLWAFGGNLVINDLTGGSVDLDGFLMPGQVQVSDQLTINAASLNDAYSTTIAMGGGTRLQMNLNEAWSTDQQSEITISGAVNAGPGVIAGSDVQIGGRIHSAVNSRFEADVTFVGTADIEIEESRTLDALGEATINGGQFLIKENANLEFDGPTTVAGGQFETFSDTSSDGAVRFNGATDWRGDAQFDGIAMQNGNATVSQASQILAEVFDMDGLGNTTWNISAPLHITASSIDSTISNSFDGNINIGGNLFQSLSVTLNSSPFDEWVMAGELNLTGALFGSARVGGSRMRVTGDLNLSPGQAGILADTTFDHSSQVTFASSTSQLDMRGQTRVRSGAQFVGDGTMFNHATGHMTLDDGVSTNDVGLRNTGLLDIDDVAGIATVDWFENLAGGTLAIDLAGYLLGDEFDHLQVAGEALIDGTLAVDLLLDDFGEPLFIPQVDDEFLILTSLDGVAGQFVDVLPTHANGMTYDWEVLYHSHDITLRLANVTTSVPEPASLALLVIGLAGVYVRRR